MVFFVIALLIPCSIAYSAEETVYNPKPLPDDLVLPMPNGAEMVFRPVIVPGDNFWGGVDRIVTLGDSQAGMFSELQKNMINGSFPAEDNKNWLIWIAKYELTVGQFVAVMGADALAEHSGDKTDRNYTTLSGKKLEQAQTKPIAWISHASVNAFIREYNAWLFDSQHPERIMNIPNIEGVPGFIRLPTEEEWEFAARGGIQAIIDETFDQSFPFPENKLKDYAWFGDNAKSGKRSIGYKKPNILGIHGMYGNVEEMVGGIFRPEMTQGKPGGIPVRGGGFRSSLAQAKVGIRREFEAYKWDKDSKIMEEGRTFTIGARLAIGSNVLPDSSYMAIIERDYEQYRKSIRQETPTGQRNQNLAGQATTQLGNIDDALQQIINRYPDATREISDIQQYMDKARGQLEQAQYKGAHSLVQDASRNAVNIIELLRKKKQIEEALAHNKSQLEIALENERNNILDATESGAEVNRYFIGEFEKRMHSNEDALDKQYRGYLGKINEVSQEYGVDYQDAAIKSMHKKQLTAIESIALGLVEKHIITYRENQKVEKDPWWKDIEQAFKLYSERFIEGTSQVEVNDNNH